MKSKQKYVLAILILLSLLVVTSYRTFQFKENYTYPLHGDEWQHYTFAQSLEGGLLSPRNLYYEEENPYTHKTPLFHISLFALQQLGLTPSLFIILPLLQIVAFTTAFYLFTRELTNWKAATMATAAALFVKNTFYVIGFNFLTPYTTGLVLLFLSLYLLEKNGLNKGFLITTLALLFTYPTLVIPLAIYTTAYLYNQKGSLERKHWLYIATVGAGIAGFTLYLQPGILGVLEKITYTLTYTGNQTFNLFSYFGIAFCLLYLTGLYPYKEKWLPLHAATTYLLLNLASLFTTGYSFGLPYVRILYLLGLLASVPVAKGIYHWTGEFITNPVYRNTAMIVLTIAACLSGIAYYTGGGPPDSVTFSEKKAEGIRYMKGLNKSQKVLAPKTLNAKITPLSGFHVETIPRGFLLQADRNRYAIFEKSSCQKKIETLEIDNFGYVASEQSFDCWFLEELYGNSHIHVYNYTKK